MDTNKAAVLGALVAFGLVFLTLAPRGNCVGLPSRSLDPDPPYQECETYVGSHVRLPYERSPFVPHRQPAILLSIIAGTVGAGVAYVASELRKGGLDRLLEQR